MELFLFIANLFNRFELSCEDPNEPPSMKKTFRHYSTTARISLPCQIKIRMTDR
ncbi:hypothetical protein OSTOST_14944 [Ostertagia ostertagi]